MIRTSDQKIASDLSPAVKVAIGSTVMTSADASMLFNENIPVFVEVSSEHAKRNEFLLDCTGRECAGPGMRWTSFEHAQNGLCRLKHELNLLSSRYG